MKDNNLKGVVYIILSALSFSFMQVFVKVADDLPTVEKLLFRNFISLGIAYVMLKRSRFRGPLLGKPENRKMLLLRSVMGLIGVYCSFYALDNLLLVDASLLGKLSPCFATLFAALFLKEKLSKLQVPCLILIFLFAIFIIKPRFDMSVLPALAGAFTGVMAGGAYTIVRYLKGREEPATIVFFFSLVSVVGVLPFVFFNCKVPSMTEAFYLLMIGIFGSGGQFGLTLAYKNSKASQVSIYNYSGVLFALLLDIVIFVKIPDLWSMVGGAGIIATSVVLFMYNMKSERTA